MNYMKTPLRQKKSKSNKRVLSGGAPAERKRTSFFKKSSKNGSAGGHGKRIKPESTLKKKSLPGFTPWKMIVASFVVGICGIFYISHVLSTQQVLQEVQQLENEYNKTQRLYEEKRLSYDRMVGPKEIYKQAREEGFINAGPADQIIILEQ